MRVGHSINFARLEHTRAKLNASMLIMLMLSDNANMLRFSPCSTSQLGLIILDTKHKVQAHYEK